MNKHKINTRIFRKPKCRHFFHTLFGLSLQGCQRIKITIWRQTWLYRHLLISARTIVTCVVGDTKFVASQASVHLQIVFLSVEIGPTDIDKRAYEKLM